MTRQSKDLIQLAVVVTLVVVVLSEAHDWIVRMVR